MATKHLLCNLRLEDPMGGENSLPRCHIGILSIAAHASESGCLTEVIDGDADGLQDMEVFERICSFSPKLVGFTATQATISRVLLLCEQVARSVPGVVIVLGGEQATFTAERLLSDNRSVNAILTGEGEIPFAMLAAQLSLDSPVDFSGIPGATYLRANAMQQSAPAWVLINPAP